LRHRLGPNVLGPGQPRSSCRAFVKEVSEDGRLRG
jgi:hypothetical protein